MKTMRPKTRFIKSVIETAAQAQVEMPWARGSRRVSFANKRLTSVLMPIKMTA